MAMDAPEAEVIAINKFTRPAIRALDNPTPKIHEGRDRGAVRLSFGNGDSEARFDAPPPVVFRIVE